MEEKVTDKVKEQVTERINDIIQEGVNINNLDALGKLVDIHKDLSNEKYWKEKEEALKMRYRGDYDNYVNYPRENYMRDNYGRRTRDSRGRYSGHNGHGQPDEEMMNEMYRNYQRYSEGREQYGRGNYNAKEDTMKSLECMLESMVDFVEMLKENANSQEEIQLIKEYTKEISEI